jgi:ABC-type multidrug transport system fused ATPase/permease subunit
MKLGSVVERGNHNSLMEKKGYYSGLIAKQMRGSKIKNDSAKLS